MSLAYLQIISIDNDCHSSCIAISTEKHRFLVEVGEGTQRLIVEHRVRLGKIASILLTSGQICSIGGLPGMLLTLDDAGISSPHIICPVEAQKYIQSTQYFMRSLGNYQIITNTNTTQPIHFDELTITPILLSFPAHSSSSLGIENRLCYIGETSVLAGKFDIQKAIELKIPKGPLYGKLKNGQTIQLEDGRMISPDLVVGEATPAQYFAIICRIEDPSQLSYLIEQSIWSSFSHSSSSSSSSDTNEESSKRLSVMVHLSKSSITSHSMYQHWLHRFPSQTEHIFIGFQENDHGKSAKRSSFLASSLYNTKLFHLFGDNFTPLMKQSQPSSALDDQEKPKENLLKFHLLPIKKQGLVERPYDSLLQLQQQELDAFLQETKINYPYLSELQRRRDRHFNSSAEKYDNYRVYFLGTGCAIPSKFRNVSSFLVYIPFSQQGILLDCGEATWHQLLSMESPARKDQSSTTDANEKEVQDSNSVRWAKIIKIIWISHPHADHHLGLVNLLLQRQRLLLKSNISSVSSVTIEPAIVIAPMSVYCYLRDACEVYQNLTSAFLFIPNNYFDPTESCNPCLKLDNSVTHPLRPITSVRKSRLASSRLLSAEETADSSSLERTDNKRLKSMSLSYERYYQQSLQTSEILSTLKERLRQVGIMSLINIPVIHCQQAYGLIFTVQIPSSQSNPVSVIEKKTIKIVYSGDTRPCDQLVFYGRNADLLIHEATFEDDKPLEAINKRHSTISEACEVGQLMNCSAIVLTHFSQRYHGVPLQFHPKGINPLELIDQKIHNKMNDQHDSTKKKDLLPIIAFDFLRFSNHDLTFLPQLTYPIAEIFAKEAQSEEELQAKEEK